MDFKVVRHPRGLLSVHHFGQQTTTVTSILESVNKEKNALEYHALVEINFMADLYEIMVLKALTHISKNPSTQVCVHMGFSA